MDGVALFGFVLKNHDEVAQIVINAVEDAVTVELFTQIAFGLHFVYGAICECDAVRGEEKGLTWSWCSSISNSSRGRSGSDSWIVVKRLKTEILRLDTEYFACVGTFVDVDSDYVGGFVMYVTKRSNEFVMGEQCPIRDN